MNAEVEAVNLVVSNTLKVTDVAARLAGLGTKNLAALLFAMVKDIASGRKVDETLMQLLQSGDTGIIPIDKSEIDKFQKAAKYYPILYKIVRDSDKSNPTADVIVRASDDENIRHIFKKIGYIDRKLEQDGLNLKNQQPRSAQSSELQKQKSGSTRAGGVIVSRVEDAKQRLANQAKNKSTKGKER